MKKEDEIVFRDTFRDDTSTLTATAHLQYGVWDKLPTLIDLFDSDDVNHGYAFAGWTTTSGGQADYIDGEWVKNLAQPDMTATLYGAWVQRYYYINYNANGGVIEQPVDDSPDYSETQRVISVDTVTLPNTSEVTRAGGWMLDGWSKTPYGLKGYEPGGQYKGIFNDFSVGTLYAVWKPLKYQVRFHSNWPKDIGKPEEIEEQEIEYNIITKLRANTMEFTHWEFSGWATSPTGTIAYIDEQRVVNLTEEQTGIDLYARWTQVEFVMTFHKNAPGGSGEPVIPDSDDPDEPIEPIEPTDEYITGEMEEEVFRINVAKTINLNQYVYPKEITIDGKTYDTKDRGFNGWLTASGGYTEQDDGHYRIEWLNGEEIVLDRDVDVYAFWDDCIYIEYDSTTLRRLRRDFELEYPALAAAFNYDDTQYKLVDRIHPGEMYRIRNDFHKMIYGCNLVAWGSYEAVNFQPGDEIHADLFNAGEHFELIPLYQKRREAYNAADKGDMASWGIDSTKINDKDYINGLAHFKLFEILPRSDYIEDYLDVEISVNTVYKDNGGPVTIYWLPESDPNCEWQKLYDIRSGTSHGDYKKTYTISVPGWYVESKGRYIYYLAVVMCPYDAVPGKVGNWGDPARRGVRGWKKWKRKFTNVATAALCVVAPTTALVLKPTRDRIKSATEKTIKEIARVKIAGHNTGEAIVKAIASKEFKIAMGAISAIVGCFTAGAGTGVLSTISGTLSVAAGACTITSATTNSKDAKKWLDAAAIGLSVAAIGTGVAATIKNSAEIRAINSYVSVNSDAEEGWKLVDNLTWAPQNENEILRIGDVQNYLERAAEQGFDVTGAYLSSSRLTLTSDYGKIADVIRGIATVKEAQATGIPMALEALNDFRSFTPILNNELVVTTAISAINICLAAGSLSDVFKPLINNGSPNLTASDIEGIYTRTSDGNLFVKLRNKVVVEIKAPGINWKPICIVNAVTIDSIIYPVDDQGIRQHNY